MDNSELINTYIDELSYNDDFSIIYIDSSNNQTIIKTYNNLKYFEPYSNLIHYSVPSGYTDDKNKEIGNYPIGIIDVKASEHHLKIYYDVAPVKKQSLITVNYLLHDNLINSNTTTGTVGDYFDASSAQNNIPAGYQFLEVSSGLTNQYTYQDQTMNIELTKDPTTSSIEIIYEDEDSGNILNSFSVSGQVGSPFQISTYESQTPNNYEFDGTNSSITTFTPDSNVVIINCKIETGTITVNYSDNGSIVSSTTVTGDVGDSFDLSSYTNNIPSGYNYAGDSSPQVSTFQLGNQIITINITPAQVTMQVDYVNKDKGNTVGTHTYIGYPNTKGYAGWDVPSGYQLASGANEANFTYGIGNTTNYNVYVQSVSSSSASATPASSSSNNTPIVNIVTRPVVWEDKSGNKYSGGSSSISAPAGFQGNLTELAEQGSTVTPPPNCTIHNGGNILHFTSYYLGQPVIIRVSSTRIHY